jgi:hypothetical protein
MARPGNAVTRLCNVFAPPASPLFLADVSLALHLGSRSPGYLCLCVTYLALRLADRIPLAQKYLQPADHQVLLLSLDSQN